MSKKQLYILIGIGFSLMCLVLYGAFSLIATGNKVESTKPTTPETPVIEVITRAPRGETATRNAQQYGDLIVYEASGGEQLVEIWNKTNPFSISLPEQWNVVAETTEDNPLNAMLIKKDGVSYEFIVTNEKNELGLSLKEWVLKTYNASKTQAVDRLGHKGLGYAKIYSSEYTTDSNLYTDYTYEANYIFTGTNNTVLHAQCRATSSEDIQIDNLCESALGTIIIF